MYDLGKQFHIDLSKLKASDKVTIRGDKYRFTILSERLIRLEYSETGKFNDFATSLVNNRIFDMPKFEVREDNSFLEITTSYFKLEYAKNTKFKAGKINPDKNLKVTMTFNNDIWYYSHPEAKNFYGSSYELGPVKEETINKGLYSYDGFVSIDDSNTYRINELGGLETPIKDNLDIYLFVYNKDFGLALKDYFVLTGNPSLIPRYALGNWWSKNIKYKTEDVKKVVTEFRENEIPISTLLLDKYWHITEKDKIKGDTGFSFNTELIDNPSDLINHLHENNIKLGLNVNPKDGFLPYENFFEEAKKYLGVTENKIKFEPTNPRFLDIYYKVFLNPLENIGIDFFWNDYNDGMNKLWILNHYGYLNSERNANKRAMMLSRNSMQASHRYPILYSGETRVDWKTLKQIPFYNLSSTNIGTCWWSHDVGGYTGGIEDSELYTRSVQLGVFSPILRFHSDSGKYYKREPWRWDKKTYEITKDYLQTRHKLVPYLYTEAYKYHHDGAMVFQPLYYVIPKIYDDINYRNEYFFGSELLVAPIVNSKEPIMNRTIHRFYLPEGIWYDFFTGKKYIGNKKYVSFYKDEDYPVFARRGSIIPMDSTYDNDINNPVSMDIHVFPGENNKYNLYEDDGISQGYKKDEYCITEFDYNYLKNNYTLIIRPIKITKGMIPDKRNYKIIFRNTKQADEVIVREKDKVIETNNYTLGPDFIVEIQDVSVLSQITVNCKGQDIEIDAVRLINEDIDQILLDLQIETELKEAISEIVFSDKNIKQKRIAIRRLKNKGLDKSFIKLFINLLEYIDQI